MAAWSFSGVRTSTGYGRLSPQVIGILCR